MIYAVLFMEDGTYKVQNILKDHKEEGIAVAIFDKAEFAMTAALCFLAISKGVLEITDKVAVSKCIKVEI